MTQNNAQPPRLADWLLSLIVPSDQGPQILGDLLEEFSTIASRQGIGSARGWYWRQSAKAVPHLISIQFRLAPWRNLAGVVVGLLLLWQANVLVLSTGLWVGYPADWPQPLRLLWLASFPDSFLVIAAILVGLIVAYLSERREMAVTLIFSVTTGTLRVISFFVHWRQFQPGGTPFWSYLLLGGTGPGTGVVAIPIAILAGGLIARKVAGMDRRAVG